MMLLFLGVPRRSTSLYFSDSFWYNAVEAEVYAMASLFIALLFWVYGNKTWTNQEVTNGC
jgi:hypothetical protein